MPENSALEPMTLTEGSAPQQGQTPETSSGCSAASPSCTASRVQ